MGDVQRFQTCIDDREHAQGHVRIHVTHVGDAEETMVDGIGRFRHAQSDTKDIGNYIYDTFGRFPAYIDPMVMYMWIQAQHIELDFYDKYYRPGTYLDTHRNHMQRWHKAVAAKARKAA